MDATIIVFIIVSIILGVGRYMTKNTANFWENPVTGETRRISQPWEVLVFVLVVILFWVIIPQVYR